MLVLIVGEAAASLRMKASKVPGSPLFPGKTAFVHSRVSYKYPALVNTTELVLTFKMPSYIVYEQYSSNGSLSPDDVSELKDGNFRFVTFKFKRLLTSEHVDIQVAVHVHQDDGFNDGKFHNAPCVVSLRYHDENPCGLTTLEQTEVAMVQISFFSPECDGFGPLNHLLGGTKDSQITASSSHIRNFLPYSAKFEEDISGWMPLRGSGGELHTVHFMQVDLRYVIQTKFVAAVQGLSPKIPTDKLVLVLSEDGVEWTETNTAIETGVDRSAGSTLTVLKIFKFTATARFVLPPFQKLGEEQPAYKVEFYGCPDEGKTNGNGKKVPVPVGVGMESGVITDNQLTSSSNQGLEYGAQYSRLNSRLGAGAWCAGSCDSSEFLQINLGQVYLIYELEVQSKHDDSGDTNSVLSFYFEYSVDAALWEYYTANGANKLFVGSPVRNLAVRHKLLFPVHAQIVRFRPQTNECANMACMRVELLWYPDPDPESPVIFARSFLLEGSTNTMFVCKTEVKKYESHCKGSKDGGETWKDLQQNVLIVLAYNPVDNFYYGISTNKKTLLQSKSFPFLTWTGISYNIRFRVKESPSLITATEVPFIPALPGRVHKPFAALTLPPSGVSVKQRQRSVASIDMWGSSSQGLLFKPSGSIAWKLVYSWIDYPYDIKVGCLGMPCENGTCSKVSNGGYKCNCFPGFTGKNCGKDIDECASNPCINGATCVDKVNRFNCTCPPGFTGTLCGIDIDECASSPCVKGDCIDGVNHYTCNCHPGHTGVNCELDLSCVTSNPCFNGGTCIPSSGGGYTCNCTYFYSGSNCHLGSFSCLRLSTYSFDPPHWTNTGKFDKIAFSLSADHKLLGISVGSTAKQGIPVTLTIKISNISGGVIASTTTQHIFRHGIPYYPVYFDQPILLTANQQYIAASLVEGANMPELARSFDGSAIRFCNPHLTVTFSNVSAEEMADSNGSTVQEGQIIFLYFKPP